MASKRHLELMACADQMDDVTKALTSELVEQMVFFERQLLQLRKLPHISVDPVDNTKQTKLPAYVMFRDYSSKYNDVVAKLSMIYERSLAREAKRQDREAADEKSPYQAYMEATYGQGGYPPA